MSDSTNFPELTESENAEIRLARDNGMTIFFAAFPDAETQARRTLQAARDFNGHEDEPTLF